MAGWLAAGILCLIACHTGRQKDAVSLTVHDDELTVRAGGMPVLSYIVRTDLPHHRFADSLPAYYARSGFLAGVRTPAGRIVTDDFPVGHTHQHGIFTAWTNTTFRSRHVDFWNQHEGTGTARHAEVMETYGAAGVAGFRVRLEQVSAEFGTVLSEEWHVRVYDRTEPFVWDLRSVQTNVTDDTLYLNRHAYGGLGVRGSPEWNTADSLSYRSPVLFLTSEGLTRIPANHTRPAWTAMYGRLEDKDGGGTGGIAVFPHPADRHGPRFVRVHPEMPYLSITPVAEAGFALAPGETYLSRYRFVTFDGEPDPAVLDALAWDTFAAADDPGM